MSKPSIKSLFLPGPAGRLEALLNTGSANGAPDRRDSCVWRGRSPSYAAVVAHPHPLFGGTMHNKVVYHAAKTLNEFGFPVLRFNFRGVGASQGKHDIAPADAKAASAGGPGDGRGEVDDVRAALEWLAGEFHLPIIFAGFSFGAAVGLRAVCAEISSQPKPTAASAGDRGWGVQALILLGLPLHAESREYHYGDLRGCAQPKLFVSGERDQYAPTQALAELIAGLPGANRFVAIPGADHFFNGHLPEMRTAIRAWVEETLLGGRVAV
ncbi:MAG: alpha/beta family hydrolase [Candidatus Korobacteraceae bacterium]